MARETQLFLQAHVAIYTSEREAHASGRTETAVGIKSGGSWNTPEIKHPLFSFPLFSAIVSMYEDIKFFTLTLFACYSFICEDQEYFSEGYDDYLSLPGGGGYHNLNFKKNWFCRGHLTLPIDPSILWY